MTLIMLMNHTHQLLRKRTPYQHPVWRVGLVLLVVAPVGALLVYLNLAPEFNMGVAGNWALALLLSLPIMAIGLMWDRPVIAASKWPPPSAGKHSTRASICEWGLVTGLGFTAFVLGAIVAQIHNTSPLIGERFPPGVMKMIDVVLYVAIGETVLLFMGGLFLLWYRQADFQALTRTTPDGYTDFQQTAHAAVGVTALTTGLITLVWVVVVPTTTTSGFTIQVLYGLATSSVIMAAWSHLHQAVSYTMKHADHNELTPTEALTQLSIFLVMLVTFIHVHGQEKVNLLHWVGLCLLLVAPIAWLAMASLRHKEMDLGLSPPWASYRWGFRLVQVIAFCLLLVPSPTDNLWWYAPVVPSMAPWICWLVGPPTMVSVLVLLLSTVRFTSGKKSIITVVIRETSTIEAKIRMRVPVPRNTVATGADTVASFPAGMPRFPVNGADAVAYGSYGVNGR